MPSLHVKPGACLSGDGSLTTCALDVASCGEEDKFLSAGELFAMHLDSPERSCIMPSPTATGLVGRCKNDGDRYTCTSTKDSCQYPATFLQNAGTCTLHKDVLSDSPTEFGFCENKDPEKMSFCGWSEVDCPLADGTYKWNVVESHLTRVSSQCLCEHVATGACESKNNGFYCAVSESVCEADGSKWVSALEVLQRSDVDCRLCESLVTPEPTVSPASVPTLRPTQRHTLSPQSEAPVPQRVHLSSAPVLLTNEEGTNTTSQPISDVFKSGYGTATPDANEVSDGVVIAIVLAFTILTGCGGCFIARMTRSRKASTRYSGIETQATADEQQVL